MGSQVGEKVGSYRLLRSLGKGGFGEVFEATHVLTRQRVALKLLLPHIQESKENARRFLREAEALAQLEHPGIVRILHFDRLKDETVYIAMEYLEGQTLHAWMQERHGRVSLDEALAICKQIASAMTEVHAKDIIHRDLKPGNVFLIPGAAGPQVKILDFGIAKVPSTQEIRPDTDLATAPTQVLGSEGYMSPEHYEGADHVKMPADVYALGLMLFEMIAGQRPFTEKDTIELMLKLQEESPLLQDLVPTVPTALSTFIASILAKDPAQRPSMLRVREKLSGHWEREQKECLLPGLEPFSGNQAELLFGRQTESQDILARLDRARTGEHRWIQIEGPSGVGKTSLVQAGVLTRLEEQRLPNGNPRWRVARFRPSDDPIRALAHALFAANEGPDFKPTREDIERSLREDDEEALTALAKAHTPSSAFLLLVIEQMEELFALGAGPPRFDALVSAALTAPDSPVRMLSTMRREFLHRMDQSPKLANLLDDGSQVHLLPMEEAKLTQVVQGMVQRVGMKLSEGLAERMIREAAGADSRLPLLGYTLRELWTPQNEIVTHERYLSSGGVSGTLNRHADKLLKDLGEEERKRAKWIILDLVQVGRGVPDTRRPRTTRHVLAAAGAMDDDITRKVLRHLTGETVSSSGSTAHNLRLLARSDDPTTSPDSQRVDLVHEALLREERTIARWIEEERSRLERHADLESAAQAWKQAGSQTTEGLPSGSLLDHYRLRTEDKVERERSRRMATDLARRFLGEAERLSLHRLRITWVLWATLVLGVTMILFFAIVARREQKRAEETLSDFIALADKIASDTDWKLARIHHTLQIRQDTQLDIDERLTSMLLKDPDNVEVLVVAIRATQRRSDLAREDESLLQARQYLQESRLIIERGLSIEPKNQDLNELLGLYFSKLGKVELAQGNLERAQGNFAAACEISMTFAIGTESHDSIRIRATNESEQADVEMAKARHDNALQRYDLSLALLGKLVQTEKITPPTT